MNGQVVNRTLLLLALFLPTLQLYPLFGDEIHLRNGRMIGGQIIRETSKRLVIEVPYGKLTLNRDEVLRIVRESEADYLKDASDRVYRAGDVEEALNLLRRRIPLEPENPLLEEQLIGQLQQALRHWIGSRQLEKALEGVEELSTRGAAFIVVDRYQEQIERLLQQCHQKERRAIEAWNAGESDEAYRLWQELRSEFPYRAQRWRKPLGAAALRLGHNDLLGRRVNSARSRYLDALELDPELLPALREPLALCELERLRPILEQGHFEHADQRLLAALEILPDEPALLFHRAIIAEATGSDRAAAKIYSQLAGTENRAIEGHQYLEQLRRRAADRIQSGVVLEFTEEDTPEIEPTAEQDSWESIPTEPFLVHFRRGFDVAPVLESLQRNLQRLESEWFGNQQTLPREREISVYLHSDRIALQKRAGVEVVNCDGFVKIERKYGILLKQEIHLNSQAKLLTSGVIPHELAHLLLPYRIGRGLRLAPWLDEGIACNEEPKLLRRHRRRTLLDALQTGSLQSLIDLFNTEKIPNNDRGIFYAQSASVVEFLRERLGVIDTLAFARVYALKGPEPALREIAGYDTVGDLQLAWSRWLLE